MLLYSLSKFVGPSLNLFLQLPVKCPPVLLMHSWWIHLQQLDRCFRCPLFSNLNFADYSQRDPLEPHGFTGVVPPGSHVAEEQDSVGKIFLEVFCSQTGILTCFSDSPTSSYLSYLRWSSRHHKRNNKNKKALEKKKFTLWWAALQWCWLISFG